jgi:WD40 repeat protein
LNSYKIASAWPTEQGELGSVAFQPGTGILASAGTDVRLWQTAPPQLVLHLGGFDKRVRALSFSLDGARLVAVGDAEIVRHYFISALHDALHGLGLGW